MALEQRHGHRHVHRASAWRGNRLRGHSEWPERIFPAMPGMPVTIRLGVRPFSYRIVVVTNAGDVVRETSTSPGDGWRLLVPFERNGQPGAWLLTGSWMAVLLAPLGYLASLRSRGTVVAAAARA